jgi:hypothetical protein
MTTATKSNPATSSQRFTLLALIAALALLAAPAAQAQTVIYVDTDAAGAETGDSWGDAYTDLQDALADPATSSASDAEI